MWRQYLRKVEPYTPGEQPDSDNVIKLNTNENPYPPCEGVKRVLSTFDTDTLRKYPDPNVKALRTAIADYYNLSMENVFVGVGSDDVIAMCYMTFFNSPKPILFPDITYSFYDVWADEFRVPYKTKALDDEYRIVASDYAEDNGGIIIPNPNAPTGIAEGKDFFTEILNNNPDSIVIIDEAYVDFGAESVIDLIGEYENLIVVRTFSKSRSLAGSRIGFALGNAEAVRALHDVKYSFNSYTMDRITIELGVEAIKDDEYFRECVSKIICTKKQTQDSLRNLGFEVFESAANFLLVKPKGISAEELYTQLKNRGIFVRYFNKPRLSDYLRITIGTDEEMDKLTEALQSILEAVQ